MAWSFGHTVIVLLTLLVGAVAGWLFRGARAGDARTNASISARMSPDVSGGRPDETPSDLGAASSDAGAIDTEALASGTETAANHGDAVSSSIRTTEAEASAVTVDAPPDDAEAPAVTAANSATVVDHAHTAVVMDHGAPAVDDAPEPVVAPASAADQRMTVPTQATGSAITEPPSADTDPAAESATTEPPSADTEPAPVDSDVTEAATAGDPAAEAVATSVPVLDAPDTRPGADDDLRRIEGIGPKMANALTDAGIRTYRQLADIDVDTLRNTVRAAGMRAPASLPTWPQQAATLVGSADTVAAYPGPGPDETGV